MPISSYFIAVLLLVCGLTCHIARDILYVQKPAALNKVGTSVLCDLAHQY